MSEEIVEFTVTDRRGQVKETPKAPELTPVDSLKAKKNIKTSPLFSNLLMSLSSSALMYLGAMPAPSTGETMFEPEAAKQQVELLTMLKEKTEGNRSDEENQIIDEALYGLHLRFVELSKVGSGAKPIA